MRRVRQKESLVSANYENYACKDESRHKCMLVQSIKAYFRVKPPLTGYYKEYPRNAFLQFCSCFIYKWRSLCQAFPGEAGETGTKNRCVMEVTCLENIQFRAFPKRVGPRILSLESVDYFGTSEHY